MRTLLLPLVLLVPTLLGCASDGGGRSFEHSRGVVVAHAPNTVWAATRAVLVRVGRGGAKVDEGERTASAVVDGAIVTVRVEPYDSAGSRTILRVIADEEETGTAQKVQDWITAQLPR